MSKCHLLAGLVLFSLASAVRAEDLASRWIWTGEAVQPEIQERFFRRTFALGRVPAKATLTITCDSQYEVYINGSLAGSGNEWKLPGVFNVAPMLVRGTNVIGVKGTTDAARAGALLVDLDGGEFHVVSDGNWNCYGTELKGWLLSNFAAEGWKPCEEIGRADAAPWNLTGWPKNLPRAADVAPGKGNFVNGYRVPEGFVVDQFAGESDTSSVLCMTFNGKGQLLTAAAGNGPTEIRILDTLNGVCTGHRVFWMGLHCQGITAIGNDLYVIGNGKLYLLEDKAGQGRAEIQEPLSKMLGSMTEHGPHAIVLGPDGHFYIMLGNDSSFKMNHLAATSPIREEQLYWGNLLPLQGSNFLDGKGPPGGRILRTDVKGKEWEVIAHGFRNDYDFAFSAGGEIFGFDSDMEWDIGLPWYRPVRTVHVPFGANFGWRYGSGKWKNHFADGVPPMSEQGRGSPTGIEVYNHVAYPEEYRDAVFMCDWSRARILVMKPQRDGATWKGEPEEFLTVHGVNFPVTGARVGPDGAMYFCWGGRGAKGGVIRVRYVGAKPMRTVFSDAELKGIPAPIATALDTPQFQSAFGRAAIERQKITIGNDWTWQLAAVARDATRTDALRGRALDLLSMNGEIVDPVLLADLAKDKSAFVRAQAAQRIALNGDPSAHALLKTMLDDSDAWVLRRACEGLMRFPDADAIDKLAPLLGHADRFVRYAASSALLRLPCDKWSAKASSLPTSMGKAEGLLTLAQWFQSMDSDPKTIDPYVDKMLDLGLYLLDSKLTPDETLVALRGISLTLLAHVEKPAALETDSKILPQSRPFKPLVPAAQKDRLIARCTALLDHDDTRVTMDAAEILGFLADGKAIAPLVERVKNDLLTREERIHDACAAANIPEGWTPRAAADLMEFLAAPGPGEDGSSFAAHLRQCAARLGKNLTAEQRMATFNALKPAAKTYAIAVQGFNELGMQTVVDEYNKATDIETRKLMLGKIASVGNDEAFRQLEKFLDDTSPVYDTELTLLMRFNHADAKKYAVAALTSSSRGLASEALARVTQLIDVDPKDPNLYYGLIVCAARSNESRIAALALLKRWPIDNTAIKELPPKPEEQIEFWERIYKKFFPNDRRSFPEFSGNGYQDPAKYQKLLAFLGANPPAKTGNIEAGRTVFSTTAKCINCHVFQGAGKQIGPELTDVAKRFDLAKIVDDIVYPSKVVDARYRQILFTTKDGQRLSGFASAETDETLSVTNGEAVTVILKKADIAKKMATEKSIMPDGLIDALTPEQIRDLLAFLQSGKK